MPFLLASVAWALTDWISVLWPHECLLTKWNCLCSFLAISTDSWQWSYRLLLFHFFPNRYTHGTFKAIHRSAISHMWIRSFWLCHLLLEIMLHKDGSHCLILYSFSSDPGFVGIWVHFCIQLIHSPHFFCYCFSL